MSLQIYFFRLFLVYLTFHFRIKLTDISSIIKEKTKQKLTNKDIKNVIKQMDGVEIVPKKKPETARRKEKTRTLFNE